MISREKIEQLMRDAGHAINANNGQCPVIEGVLCRVTALCVELLKATEQQQLIAMLARAEIGHGTRTDWNPAGESVQVESEDANANDDWWVTEFGFDANGQLKTVVTYPGEEG